jgi:hypothetical protein
MPEARRDEIDEDLPKGLLFFAASSRERSVDHQGVELWAPSVEARTDIDQLMAQGTFGVDCPFRFAISRAYFEASALAMASLLGKLVKGCRRHARFRGNRVCGGVVVAKAPEHRGCSAEEFLLALLTSRVALAVWVEDGHRTILAEGRDPSKNLHL